MSHCGQQVNSSGHPQSNHTPRPHPFSDQLNGQNSELEQQLVNLQYTGTKGVWNKRSNG